MEFSKPRHKADSVGGGPRPPEVAFWETSARVPPRDGPPHIRSVKWTALPLEGIPLITPISTSACFRRTMRGRSGVVDAANVLYAGVSPGTAGLYQLNM